MHGSSQGTNKFSVVRGAHASWWQHAGPAHRWVSSSRQSKGRQLAEERHAQLCQVCQKKQRASSRRPTEGQAYPAHAVKFTVPCKHATCKRANMQRSDIYTLGNAGLRRSKAWGVAGQGRAKVRVDLEGRGMARGLHSAVASLSEKPNESRPLAVASAQKGSLSLAAPAATVAWAAAWDSRLQQKSAGSSWQGLTPGGE